MFLPVNSCCPFWFGVTGWEGETQNHLIRFLSLAVVGPTLLMSQVHVRKIVRHPTAQRLKGWRRGPPVAGMPVSGRKGKGTAGGTKPAQFCWERQEPG